METAPAQHSPKAEGSHRTGGMELESPRWTSEAHLLSFLSIDVSQQNMSTLAKPAYSLFVFKELY